MSERHVRPRRLGVASLASMAVVAALSVAMPTALTGGAQAAVRHHAPIAPGVSAPRSSHAKGARSFVVPSSSTYEKGTVLVADYVNQRVVAIAPGGDQTTVGSGYTGPSGVSLDQSTGDIYVADFDGNTVYKITPDGTQTTVGSGLFHPEGVLAEPDGDLLISDADNQRVLRVTPEGDQSVLPFTGLERPYGLAEDADGDIFVADSAGDSVYELTPGGVQSAVGGGYTYPTDVALDSSGNLIVTDSGSNRVLRVAPNGDQQELSFTGLVEPFGVAVDGDDNVYVANLGDSTAYELTSDDVQTPLGDGVGGAGVDVATKPGQVIDFTSDAPTGDHPGDDYTVSASGGDSGNPVTFSTQTDGVCTVTDNGDGTADVSLDHAGDCVIDADQAGNKDYADAHQAHQTVTVGAFAQKIGFTSDAPTGDLPGDGYTVTAFGGGSGNPVTFSTGSDGVCTVTDNGDGSADVSLDHSGKCVVDADQAGNKDYADAPQAHQTIAVGAFAQKIGFTSDAPTGDLPGDGYTVSATGGDSGNPVTFKTGSDGVCTVTDNGDGTADVSLDHAGTCIVDADQAGNEDYADAPQAHQTVTVGKLAQGIEFTSDAPTGDLPGDGYTVTADGGDSGNPVTFSTQSEGVCTVTDNGDESADVSLDHPGKCVIDADQAGNKDYADAPRAHQTVTVGSLSQGIEFTSDAPTDAHPGDGYTVSATGGDSGNPVTFKTGSDGVCTVTDNGDGSADVSLDHAGDCVIDANQMGSGDYPAAKTAHQTVTVGQAAQPVTFTSAPGVVRVGDSYSAVATGGGSGNPVTFAVDKSTSSSCTVSPTGDVTFQHATTCLVVASQAGNGDYLDGSATQTVHARRAIQAVVFTTDAPHRAHAGTTYQATATGNPASGRKVRITGVGACSVGRHGLVSFNHRGTCTVFAIQAGNADYQPGKAKQIVTVTPARNNRGGAHLRTMLLG